MSKIAIAVVALTTAVASAQPAGVTHLGTLGNNAPGYEADLSVTISLAFPRPWAWFSFTITQDVATSTGTFLDIATMPRADTVAINGGQDTEVGLYNAAGTRLGFNDDSGVDLYSNLPFGQSPSPRGPLTFPGYSNSEIVTGSPVVLPAGTYYVVVGLWDTTFPANGFFASSNAQGRLQSFELQFRTNVVPTPGAAALLGLSGLVASRRRRA